MKHWFRCRVAGEERSEEVLAATAAIAAADFAEMFECEGRGCPAVVRVDPVDDQLGGTFEITRKVFYVATGRLG